MDDMNLESQSTSYAANRSPRNPFGELRSKRIAITIYRRRLAALLLALGAAALASGSAHAQLVALATDVTSAAVNNVTIAGGNYDAGQFTLTSTATISEGFADLEVAVARRFQISRRQLTVTMA